MLLPVREAGDEANETNERKEEKRRRRVASRERERGWGITRRVSLLFLLVLLLPRVSVD